MSELSFVVPIARVSVVSLSMRAHVHTKVYRVHLSPGSSCGLVAYTCATVYFLYGTYSYLLTGRDSGLMTYITRLGSLRGIHWSKRFLNWLRNERVMANLRGPR